MTIVIVSHPKNLNELRFCIDSFRRLGPPDLEFVILTEPHNLRWMQNALKGELVRPIDLSAQAIPTGYYRQQAAKLLCAFEVFDQDIVIVDDDVEALLPFDRETFFMEDRARIHYRDARGHHNWARGAKLVFDRSINFCYQLLLPFAIRRETLVTLAASDFGRRALANWKTDRPVSEFETMGEFARAYDPGRCILYPPGVHWTIDKRMFRDWQSFRSSFRKRISRFKAKASTPSLTS